MANKKYVKKGMTQRYSRERSSYTGYIISALAIAIIVLVGALSSCERVKHVEELEGYTQTAEEFVEEANLVDIEGYHVGTGLLNGITHARFQVEKNGQISTTIDVTKKFFNIIYTNEYGNEQNKNLEGKVKAYKRTYKKNSDEKTHYYYVIYTTKDKVNDLGKLK
ncbi:hypothetical protein NBE98_02105 [Clostridium swellfunianum]|uniref:hypothetical protein n=1 Tax=Clostridium swellfunianum TaxID=1367462 RepID=UPI0020306BEC|nr:hypothetical protein [Clostridium swellfunianum]MCM0647165.1 hypothetical protein [Clostridium swellfunianum]